jgi:glyoxylate carboligase
VAHQSLRGAEQLTIKERGTAKWTAIIGNVTRVEGGRTIHEFDMPYPVGRVFMPDRRIISDVRRVLVILERDGKFFNAYPIPPLSE